MGDICLYCPLKKIKRMITQLIRSTKEGAGLTAVVAGMIITIAGTTIITQKINACSMNYKINMTYTH